MPPTGWNIHYVTLFCDDFKTFTLVLIINVPIHQRNWSCDIATIRTRINARRGDVRGAENPELFAFNHSVPCRRHIRVLVKRASRALWSDNNPPKIRSFR
eukprot:NODE_44_length_33449_cov_1.575742.p39 type:complete len:100 gc:universal NODE_44_length_33449_cov_1.575742:12207-11908(-)